MKKVSLHWSEGPSESLALVLLAAGLFAPLWWCQADPIPLVGLWGSQVGMELKHVVSHLLFQESPKISQHWREAKPKGNLTYHQYVPPEPRQGSRADPQAKGSAEGPPGPPLCEEKKSQQPPSRYDLCSYPPGSSSPQHPPPSNQVQGQGNQSLVPFSPRTQESRSPAPLPSVSRSPALRPESEPPAPPLPCTGASLLGSLPQAPSILGPYFPASSGVSVFKDPTTPFLCALPLTSASPPHHYR